MENVIAEIGHQVCMKLQSALCLVHEVRQLCLHMLAVAIDSEANQEVIDMLKKEFPKFQTCAGRK